MEHTLAGYMIGASTTFKYVFDHRPDDIYWCTADCGWITGHSYVAYGMPQPQPLAMVLCAARSFVGLRECQTWYLWSDFEFQDLRSCVDVRQFLDSMAGHSVSGRMQPQRG